MRQIDEARREESPNWRQDDTAQLVNQSPGHVSLQIKVAKELQTRPELKEKVKGMDVRTVSKLIERTKQVEKMERLKDQGKLEVTSDLRFGSCLDLIKDIPDKSIDLVITDPPYGADKYNELREGGYSPGASLMSDTHNQDLKTVLQLMQDLTKELMRVMKDGAHCYVWVPQQYLAYFIEAMHPLEFQYPPLYWDRGRCTQPGFGYNYMNRMEAVVYFHKPPRTKKLVTNMPNIFTCPEPSRTDRQFHTEKPQEILETFVKQSSVIGDTVLDCFAGSASTLIAARTHGRKAIGFEVDEDTYKRAQLRLLGKLQEAPA